ncbi:uncharacterized protein LOC123298201 isoform X2 [Chrysoperla carnea]|nr:uncharacterized protein LOC123298201 isoform X2 [Chrysoperla carnea]
MESQINNNVSLIYGTSPSTSSTPRFRSRNSSVRSVQTVDCCIPHAAERDGVICEVPYPHRDEDSSTSDEDEEEVHNYVKIDEDYINGLNEEIVDEGLRLYLQFLQDEIAHCRLNPPDCLNSSNSGTIPRNIGSLRLLADQFSSSPHRQWVRMQAESVPLDSIDFVSFTELLLGLFQEGGVTWERVVVLFFFCADLSIRALKESLMRTFQRITQWTTTFICDNFSRWVAANGGWTEILQTSISQASRVAFFGFCCMGIIAFCIFIRNNGAK